MANTQVIFVNKVLDFARVCRTCLSSEYDLCPIFASQEVEVRLVQVLSYCQVEVLKQM